MSMNPILLQKQIRDNATDLHDFAKELKSWGDEMKQKDEALKNDKEPSSAKKVTKEPKSVKKVKFNDKPTKPATKIGATDYAAWDKFDVEAELQKVERDKSEDSDLTDEFNEGVYDDAIIQKEKGNKFVKDQKWEEAIKCYTKAIKCYSYDAVFFANRALCYLKLNKIRKTTGEKEFSHLSSDNKILFEECEEDCNLSLKLDDTYVKAYQRRAAARMQLNKFEHAEVDLKKILILEPKNIEAKANLDKISIILKRNQTEVTNQRPVSKFTASRNKSNINTYTKPVTPIYQSVPETKPLPVKQIDDSKPVEIWPSDTDIILVKPINKPPHLRSKKPLKRIDITEIDDEEKINTQKMPTPEEPVKIHVLEKNQVIEKQKESSNKTTLAMEKTASLVSEESSKSPSLFEQQKSKILIEEIETIPPPHPENNLKLLKTEDLKVIEKINPKDVKNTVNDTKKLIENTEANLVYPKNAVQFSTSWKNFKSTEDKYKYLKMVNTRDLPKIFVNSLDSNLFSNVLEVMVKHFIENKEDIYEFLSGFTEVKRFGAIAMFLSGEDKSNLWKLLDHIKETKEKEKEDVDSLIAKYEL